MSGVSTKSIDHLGLVAGMIEELKIRETIEELLPVQSKDKKVWQEADIREALNLPPFNQMPPSQASRELAEKSGWPRRKIYNLLMKTDE